MFVVYIKDHVHQLLDESQISIFAYNNNESVRSTKIFNNDINN